MKSCLSALVAIVPLMVSSTQLAAEDTTELPVCESKDITSFSYMENLQPNSDVDVGAIYKSKTQEVIAFGKKNKLEEFQIISQDASFTPNNFGAQINMNYTVSYKPNYDAFNAFRKFADMSTVSTYRVGMENCPTDKP
ncbi:MULTISPECIES: hypothetical protein [Marinomonas]|uniref:Adhesin n=1 Tax=Marinomonas arctica TaxID=383750 RepID=A0A7H1J2N5_9GAMM|nr:MULTISPECIES: hypothetical protein [Marinomonas]MCS7486465.1 hypothetical protein [Marinomonas sp. BSi20414]QNT04751.1 hypothetical protein IBG28_13660 [Marinomonas arctica]GGN30653.1 hypothetical protein GCM10011350_23700 [Marinomonas arctica]